MRLAADGKIRLCLGHEHGIDLKPAFRGGVAGVRELMEFALANKPEKHEFGDGFERLRPMTAVGG